MHSTHVYQRTRLTDIHGDDLQAVGRLLLPVQGAVEEDIPSGGVHRERPAVAALDRVLNLKDRNTDLYTEISWLAQPEHSIQPTGLFALLLTWLCGGLSLSCAVTAATQRGSSAPLSARRAV